MQLSSAILGTPTTTKLQQRASAPLLVIGGDVFTRHVLGALDCYPARPLATLNAQLEALQVKNTRDLYTRVAPREVVAYGVGEISVAVLGAAFEVKELGTLDTWVRKHSAPDAKLVTVTTMKRHDAKDLAGERQRAKARKSQRRDLAHKHRVTRFQQRRSA